jgi:hypothetical protein
MIIFQGLDKFLYQKMIGTIEIFWKNFEVRDKFSYTL